MIASGQGAREAVAEAVDHQLGNGRFLASPLYGDGHAVPRIARRLGDVELRIEKRLTY